MTKSEWNKDVVRMAKQDKERKELVAYLMGRVMYMPLSFKDNYCLLPREYELPGDEKQQRITIGKHQSAFMVLAEGTTLFGDPCSKVEKVLNDLSVPMFYASDIVHQFNKEFWAYVGKEAGAIAIRESHRAMVASITARNVKLEALL